MPRLVPRITWIGSCDAQIIDYRGEHLRARWAERGMGKRRIWELRIGKKVDKRTLSHWANSELEVKTRIIAITYGFGIYYQPGRSILERHGIPEEQKDITDELQEQKKTLLISKRWDYLIPDKKPIISDDDALYVLEVGKSKEDIA